MKYDKLVNNKIDVGLPVNLTFRKRNHLRFTFAL